MAKEQNQKQYSKEEKLKHFAGRVADPNLSQSQRDYAARRLAALSGNESKAPQQPQQSNNRWNGKSNGGNSRVVNVYVHNVK